EDMAKNKPLYLEYIVYLVCFIWTIDQDLVENEHEALGRWWSRRHLPLSRAPEDHAKLGQHFIRFLDILKVRHPANESQQLYNLGNAYNVCGAMIYQRIAIAFPYCISWYEFLKGKFFQLMATLQRMVQSMPSYGTLKAWIKKSLLSIGALLLIFLCFWIYLWPIISMVIASTQVHPPSGSSWTTRIVTTTTGDHYAVYEHSPTATPFISGDREYRWGAASYQDSPWELASTPEEDSVPTSLASGDDYPFSEHALIEIEPPVSSLEPDSPEVVYAPDIVAPAPEEPVETTNDASSMPSLTDTEGYCGLESRYPVTVAKLPPFPHPSYYCPFNSSETQSSSIREEPAKSSVFIHAATSVVESVAAIDDDDEYHLAAIDGQLSCVLAIAIAAAAYGTYLCFLPTV
ncbi:MAG TPA: hypothetical protein VNZ86_14320, partial [Bacteroidia bacterium]|nr:hypothetical protein [Bacteroidia bacterium]